jgi:hypothetical protein
LSEQVIYHQESLGFACLLDKVFIAGENTSHFSDA